MTSKRTRTTAAVKSYKRKTRKEYVPTSATKSGEEPLNGLQDLIEDDLKILFVGCNPGIESSK